MTDITVDELYLFFLEALGQCTPALLTQDDEHLIRDLFEEFSIGATSFLHDNALAMLGDAGLIDQETVNACREIRKRWLDLVSTPPTVAEIRASNEWLELFQLSDATKTRAMNYHPPKD